MALSDDGPIVIGTRKLTDGWYWWSCDPEVIDEVGGIPPGDDIGPFETQTKAFLNAIGEDKS